MKVGDLIKPVLAQPGWVFRPALVVSIVGTPAFNRIKVLVIGSTTPEMCDPRMWEVVSASSR